MSKGRRLREGREQRRRAAREFVGASISDRRDTLAEVDAVEVTLPLIDDGMGSTMTLRNHQVEGLAALGIVREHEGRWYADDGRLVIEAMESHPALMICDACSSAPVVARHGCGDEVIAIEDMSEGTWVHASTSSWCMCETCDELIVAGDFDGLVRRAAEVIASRHDVEFDRLMMASTAVLGQFWEARTGERTAF